MTDDEIDKELRRVQLQREKLLLEKEIARKEFFAKSSSILIFIKDLLFSSLRKIIGIFGFLFIFLRNNYKKIIGVFFAILIIFALVSKYVEISNKNYEERIENFSLLKCSKIISKSCEVDSDDPVQRYYCLREGIDRGICLDNARREYRDIEKPPLEFLNN